MCLVVVLALLTPRLIMVLMWLFSNYLSHAYGTWVWPLLGFFFLPTTTIAFAIAQNEFGGFRGWGAVITVLGVLFDLGVIGGARGRGILRRDRA
ncbi:MAG TPA: hypothetical protein VHM47_03935 [Actinomycetota bacterium]|jgi:hypothetical protein|nr:hypothetical protein [Actinomycetota bacterium]